MRTEKHRRWLASLPEGTRFRRRIGSREVGRAYEVIVDGQLGDGEFSKAVLEAADSVSDGKFSSNFDLEEGAVITVMVQQQLPCRDGDAWLCTIPMADDGKTLAYGIARRHPGWAKDLFGLLPQRFKGDVYNRERAKHIAFARADGVANDIVGHSDWQTGEPIARMGLVKKSDIVHKDDEGNDLGTGFLATFNAGNFERWGNHEEDESKDDDNE